jgi:hypothetical protein
MTSYFQPNHDDQKQHRQAEAIARARANSYEHDKYLEEDA